MSISDRIRAWVYAKIPHPDKLTPIDRMLIDLLCNFIPGTIGVVISYSILLFIYTWLYNKYGFEKVIIIIGCTALLGLNYTRKAIIDLFNR